MPFPSTTEINPESGIPANARKFVGDGSHVLKSPYLKVLRKVYINGREAPLVYTYSVPDGKGTGHEELSEDMFLVSKIGPDAVLLRNVLSNHGKFQNGAQFHIVGDWEDDPAKGK